MIHKSLALYTGMGATIVFAGILWFSCFDILQVQEISMEPELFHGQTILVNKMAYRLPSGSGPALEDIVVFNSPVDQHLVVKRICLLPGNPLTIDNEGWLYLEDKRFFLTSLQKRTMSQIKYIPDGMVFVLGDNPFHSVDSRDYGCIPIDIIRGRVIHPLWKVGKR